MTKWEPQDSTFYGVAFSALDSEIPGMRPTSIQIQSVMDAFGQQGWQFEHLEGRDVIRTAFEAYHTQVHLHAQAFPQLNALSPRATDVPHHQPV